MLRALSAPRALEPPDRRDAPFAVVQLPMLDARRFLPDGATRLVPRPTWPHPDVTKEFVRRFGAVLVRRKGGLETLAGDGVFARARRAIALDPEGAKEFRLLFRRLYFEQAWFGRVEIGLARHDRTGDDDPTRFARAVAGCGTEVEAVDRNTPALHGPVAGAGDLLARLYLHATTAKGRAAEVPAWGVSPGYPSIVVEHQGDLERPWPRGVLEVPIGIRGISLHLQQTIRGRQPLMTWYLTRTILADPATVRRLRLHICRFSAHLESLRLLFSLVDSKRLPVERGEASDEMQRFLSKTIHFLKSPRQDGLPNDVLFATALDAYDLVVPGRRDALFASLDPIRGSLLRAVRDLPQPASSCVIQVDGDLVMAKSTQQLGAGATVVGDVVNAGSIADAFKVVSGNFVSGDLREALRGLISAAGAVPEAGTGLADDVLGFVKEACRSEIRPDVLVQRSKEIRASAETSGSASIPVLAQVERVLASDPIVAAFGRHDARPPSPEGASMNDAKIIQHVDAAHVGGSIVAAQSIRNSFNAAQAPGVDERVQTALVELTKKVEELCLRLPKEAGEQAARDLESLAKEATSKTPRRKWYELSAEGLVEAAKACGDLVAPIGSAVKAVLALLA